MRKANRAYQAQMAAAMDERTLQQQVAGMAKRLGLFHYHPRISTGSAPGWPDSVIVGERILFRELKSQTGRLSPEQRAVGDRLKAAGPDWAIWRPSDWLSGEIETQLRLLKGSRPCPWRHRDFREPSYTYR